MILKTQKKWLVLALLAVLASCFYYKTHSSNPVTAMMQFPTIKTVGALGRIEPRSRLINLSHDQGANGARIEELSVEEGQMVKRGQIIAIFSDYNRNKAKQALAEAQVDVTKAKLEAEIINNTYYLKELERFNKLIKSKVVSQDNKDEAEKNYHQSTANVNALKAQVNLDQINVELAVETLKQSILTSPLEGTVVKIYTRAGERVGDNGAIELADLNALDIVTEVYERDFVRVAIGQKAEIIVPGFEEKFNGEVRELGFQVMKNSLDGKDPLTNVDNRVIEVRVTLDPAAAEKLKHLINVEVNVRLL